MECVDTTIRGNPRAKKIRSRVLPGESHSQRARRPQNREQKFSAENLGSTSGLERLPEKGFDGLIVATPQLAGVLDLSTKHDWVHVVYFHSLVYTDYFGFRLLASPSYMPVAWWLTAVQFGYLALRLAEHWPAWAAIGVPTLLGMTLPPWYEELAAPARAWFYPPNWVMLSHTPLWVIFTYGGCMSAIASSAVLLYRPRAWGRALIAGLFTGACIMLSGVFWFALLGDRP
jgi:hypothetical protein